MNQIQNRNAGFSEMGKEAGRILSNMKIFWSLVMIVGLIFVSTFMGGCKVDPSVVKDTFASIDDGTWEWKEVQKFQFDIKKADYYYNIDVNLRITGKYAYSNLWMIGVLKGEGKNDTLQFQAELADETGRWLGQGNGNVLTYRIPYKQNVILKPGKYEFYLKQNVRTEKLGGITDVGIKVSEASAIL